MFERDVSGSDSLGLDLNEETDPLTQHFSYANNVTICDDGTVCPNPNNETCCTKHKGRTETNYHNQARLPESVTGLASYYAQAGYTIPGASTTPLVEVHAAQSSSVPSSATQSSTSSLSSSVVKTTQQSASVTTSTAAEQTLISSVSTSSGLSAGAKAGIGVGVGVAAMICATIAFVFYTRQRKHFKSDEAGMTRDDAYLTESKDRYQCAAAEYQVQELGTDAAKYEADASIETQPNSPHEVPG